MKIHYLKCILLSTLLYWLFVSISSYKVRKMVTANGGAGLDAVMEASILAAARAMEDKVDEEIARIDQKAESRRAEDDDDELTALRESRVKELRKAQDRKEEWLKRGHGEYTEVFDEKQFFKEMKNEERMVCHFYRENWPCKVMDKHLSILTKQHIETKFVKINAEKSPFLVDRLKIWMLPTLALIKNEKTVDYVVGFDDLGGSDDFSTDTLEGRLAAAGVLQESSSAALKTLSQQSQKKSSIRASLVRTESDEDSDFD